MTPHPPRLARLWLRLRAGRDFSHVDADLGELFELRARERGVRHARRRYWRDAFSVRSRPRTGAYPGPRPRPASVIAGVVQDARYARRVFARQGGILVMALVGLSAAVGVSTSIFSILNAVALRPVAVSDPWSLVRLSRTYRGGMTTTMTFEEYRRLREAATTVTLEATSADSSLAETADSGAPDSPRLASVTFVTGTFFETMGASMSIGRAIAARDDRPDAAPVAVVSDYGWRSRFASRPHLVGETVLVNGAPFTVIGVTSRSFAGPTDTPPAFWVPMAMYPRAFRGSQLLAPGSSDGVQVWGKLRPGHTREAAEVELTGLTRGFLADLVDDYQTRTGVQVDAAAMRFSAREGRTVMLVVAIVMTALVLTLFLAALNVANLLVATAVARQREIGVRLALGGTRARLVRQLLTEALLLGAASAAGAWVFMAAAFPTLARLARVPESFDASPDWRVYAFLATAAALTSVVAGLAPALKSTSTDLTTPLRADGSRGGTSRGSTRARGVLAAIQAAACLVLLVSGALLSRSAYVATRMDLGFDIDRLLAFSPDLENHAYDAPRAAGFMRTAAERIGQLPGVDDVALVRYPPLGNRLSTSIVRRDDGGVSTLFHNDVSANYFAAVGQRLLRGRTFSESEIASGAAVVVINAELARQLPNGDAVGRPLSSVKSSLGHAVIIGIVDDARSAKVAEVGAWYVYRPLQPDTLLGASIVVRANVAPVAAIRPIQQIARALDPDVRAQPVVVADSVAEQLELVHLLAVVASALGALALCLATSGIYGATAFLVASRTREVGIRLAVGATSRQALQLLAWQSLRPIAIGLAVGLPLAAGAGRLLAGVLIGVTSRDAMSFSLAIGALALSAAAAVLVPARRVLRIDPAGVLRSV